MKICLMDIDGKIPNLFLMRASTWHKQRGDSVKLGYAPLLDSPELCYASKMFRFSEEPQYMPECETLKGGPGYDLHAPVPFPDYDRITPDYALYGCSYAIGRFTRGCPNCCPWCVVPQMDGTEVRQVASLADFWQGQKAVRLLDDNIMVDGDLFCRACEQLSKAGVKVLWEALDARNVDDRAAAALATVKQYKYIHLAWDGHSQDEAIPRALELFRRHGLKPWRFVVYVLVGFNSSREYDLHRIETLRSLGASPFVMPFDKTDRYQKDLARWCNNKIIFKSAPSFAAYCEQAHKRG